MDTKNRINRIVERAVSRKITVVEAVERLLQEIGRGGRILTVDENLYDLALKLRDLGYTVEKVVAGTSDDDIKQLISRRVFITINGKDFVKDAAKYEYGLIWVLGNPDAKILARKIEAVLMSTGFKRNVSQVVKV